MSGVHTRTTGRVHVAGSFASQPVACHSAGRPASAIFLQGVRSDRHGEFARQNQKYVLIMFCLPESNGREAAALRGEESNAPETFGAQPGRRVEAGEDFFYLDSL